MTGTLYVVGVGPGDPELLTLKAARILREVSCICVPKGREEGSSLALSIAAEAVSLDGKEIIEAHFPMKKTRDAKHGTELDEKWGRTVETVLQRLNAGADVAFITIGDPTIYSTFFYLYDRLLEENPGLGIEIIPGVSSVNASAARAKVSLGLADEKIAVIPATYAEDLKGYLAAFDTLVLMKVHKVFGGVLKVLGEEGLTGNAIYIVKAGMSDEKIFRNIRDVKEGDLNYFSLMIVRK
ncbi:MAG: precorrin-2 C(20)-methyltransferase [Nitrospirae bacterium]|nr:precorrin-2 C(20)-methyltransferase [Nitrospirota bacterium]